MLDVALLILMSVAVLPDAFRHLQDDRVIFIGDSVSRYDYEQIAHILKQTNLSAVPANPLDAEVFHNIPPEGKDTKLLEEINSFVPESRTLDKECKAYATQSKWAIIMRYNHFLLGSNELCDCSPGPTLCCDGRFENHILRTSTGGYLAYLQLLGDRQGVLGSTTTDNFINFALHGVHPNMPCPAGVARSPTWKMTPSEVLRDFVPQLRPNVVVLNMFHWIRSRQHDTPANRAWWEEIAKSTNGFKGGAHLYWRVTSDSSGKTLPSFVHDMFRAHGWALFDVHGFIHTMSGTNYESSFASDGRHLNVQMNKAVVAQLAELLYNETGPKAFNRYKKAP